MRRRIYLHGSLKEIHPDPIEVVAETVAEAIKLVSLQLPGFAPNAVDGYKRIKVVGFETLDSLFAASDQQDLHLIPQYCGGKQGGFIQILIGAALVAASFFTGGTALAFLGPLMMRVGVMLILGGVLQLFNQPKRDDKDGEQRKNHYLGGARNTVDIGTRIPILCGRRKIGGHYLSFNISAVDVGL